MGKFATFVDKWLGRWSNAFTLWPLVPASMVAAMIAWVSTGVTWIAKLGTFGWLSAGLIAFFLYSVSYALLGRGRLWRTQASLTEKSYGDSSYFDPMAKVFEKKRLYLKDLAPIGRRQVIGKKFIDCEIIGPGTAIIGLRSGEHVPWPKMDRCSTFDVDCVEIAPLSNSHLAIGFTDCDFEGCSFYHMTLLFNMRGENQTLNWITPDFRQPVFSPVLDVEDQSVGQDK